MENVILNDIAYLRQQLDKKTITVEELTIHFLERVNRFNKSYNAFTQILDEQAVKTARILDKELEQGLKRSDLHGIPISVKDIFDVKGQINSSGSIFQKEPSNEDAAIIRKLKNAGAVLIGLNNLHEFAMGSTTENPHFGSCKNPWDPTRIPGGSSGGSAVAVATNMVVASIGTDTGGSIRLPASLCGVVGFKPTYNLIDRTGCTTLSWTLDHIGPLTRTVSDSRTLFHILNDEEVYSSEINVQANLPLQGIRIGVIRPYFFDDLHEDVEISIKEVYKDFESLGASIVDVPIEISVIENALSNQRIISQSEAFVYHKQRFEKNPEKFGEDVRYRLEKGKSFSASDYIVAKQGQRSFIETIKKSMQHVDVLLSPTNAIKPFKINGSLPEEAISNIFKLGKTPLGNLLGFPVISLPCGLIEQGYPIGFQLMALPYEDEKLLDIAECYEKVSGWGEKLQREMLRKIDIENASLS